MPSLLDPFQTYLLAVNVASLVLHSLEQWLFDLTGRERVSHVLLDVLTIGGGAVGTLLAFLLWDRKTAKDNALWHVLAASCSIIWCVIVASVYLRPFDLNEFTQNLRGCHVFLCGYLAVANVVTLVCFGVDKRRATRGERRIREVTLLGLSFTGGSIGGMLAMRLFRHKIRSWHFACGLPLMLAAQVVLVAYLIAIGVV